jgi:hypothetical protein
VCLHANRFNLLVANTIIVANAQKAPGSIPGLSIFLATKYVSNARGKGASEMELGTITLTTLTLENELKVKIFHRLFENPSRNVRGSTHCTCVH